MASMKRYSAPVIDLVILPMVGIAGIVFLWWLSSATFAPTLPNPIKTWEASRLYIMEPFEKRGELDQGILRFTWYSLVRVAKGYLLGLAFGIPLGLLLGVSKTFQK